MAIIDLSNLPKKVTITNNTGNPISVPFYGNYNSIILQSGDSVIIKAESGVEDAFYQSLANDEGISAVSEVIDGSDSGQGGEGGSGGVTPVAGQLLFTLSRFSIGVDFEDYQDKSPELNTHCSNNQTTTLTLVPGNPYRFSFDEDSKMLESAKFTGVYHGQTYTNLSLSIDENGHLFTPIEESVSGEDSVKKVWTFEDGDYGHITASGIDGLLQINNSDGTSRVQLLEYPSENVVLTIEAGGFEETIIDTTKAYTFHINDTTNQTFDFDGTYYGGYYHNYTISADKNGDIENPLGESTWTFEDGDLGTIHVFSSAPQNYYTVTYNHRQSTGSLPFGSETYAEGEWCSVAYDFDTPTYSGEGNKVFAGWNTNPMDTTTVEFGPNADSGFNVYANTNLYPVFVEASNGGNESASSILIDNTLGTYPVSIINYSTTETLATVSAGSTYTLNFDTDVTYRLASNGDYVYFEGTYAGSPYTHTQLSHSKSETIASPSDNSTWSFLAEDTGTITVSADPLLFEYMEITASGVDVGIWEESDTPGEYSLEYTIANGDTSNYVFEAGKNFMIGAKNSVPNLSVSYTGTYDGTSYESHTLSTGNCESSFEYDRFMTPGCDPYENPSAGTMTSDYVWSLIGGIHHLSVNGSSGH